MSGPWRYHNDPIFAVEGSMPALALTQKGSEARFIPHCRALSEGTVQDRANMWENLSEGTSARAAVSDHQ